MPKIEVSEETYKKLKAQLGAEIQAVEINELNDMIGRAWFIRTVTYHLVGKIEKRLGDFFLLRDASWVADSGRFTQAIQKGALNEVEPVGDALVNITAITDAFPWRHALPTEQK